VRRFLALVVVALVVPSVALAAKPPAPGTPQNSHSKAAPKVMYVLRGVLTAYTAASDSTPGSVTIEVNYANHHGAGLKKMTLVFTNLSTATKIVVKGGGELTPTDKGIVKLRFAKTLDPTNPDQLSLFLATSPRQIIDQGPATPTS
jgi:hypothetical protein